MIDAPLRASRINAGQNKKGRRRSVSPSDVGFAWSLVHFRWNWKRAL